MPSDVAKKNWILCDPLPALLHAALDFASLKGGRGTALFMQMFCKPRIRILPRKCLL
jgi:hypothetical protein